jgi:hypothetical protein
MPCLSERAKTPVFLNTRFRGWFGQIVDRTFQKLHRLPRSFAGKNHAIFTEYSENGTVQTGAFLDPTPR